jgi:hypothetical protein
MKTSLRMACVVLALAASSAWADGDCSALEQAAQAGPRNGQAWLALAACQQQQGYRQAATDTYLQVLKRADLVPRIQAEQALFKSGMERPLPAKGCEDLAAPASMSCSSPVLACRSGTDVFFAASSDERAALKAAIEKGQPPGSGATKIAAADCRIIVADQCRGLLAYACGQGEHVRVRELSLH